MARRLAETAAWLALFALGAALALQKIRSFDYWWHLGTGALIAETGALPRTDPFSYTAVGVDWLNPHWLFQLGLHGLYRLGGHEAVSLGVLACVLLLAAILASIGRRAGRAAVSVPILALALVVASDRFLPRPELASFVLLAALLWLLDRFARRADAWIFAVVPLQLLWANLHGFFAVGLALLGTCLAAELAGAWLGRAGARRRAALLAAVLALGGAALINPYGLEGALFPLDLAAKLGSPEARAARGIYAVETQSPLTNWRSMAPLEIVAPLLLLAVAGLAIAVRARRVRLADPLVLLVFLGIAILAKRNIALFAIAAAPIAVRNWNALLDARPERVRRAGPAAAWLAALVVALLATDAARGGLSQRLGALRQPGIGVMEVLHPVGAANWIARQAPPGPLFHHMGDGGYLLWRLHPDWRVMLDGRTQVYGQGRLERLHAVEPDDFARLDRSFRFGTVLLNHGQFRYARLLRALHEDPLWRLCFLDDAAAVFVREPAACAATDVDALPPLDGPADAADYYRRAARLRLLQNLGRMQRAYELLVESRARHPGRFEP